LVRSLQFLHEGGGVHRLRSAGRGPVAEVDRPTAKDNQVLVKVHATTVNRTDCGVCGFKGLPFGAHAGYLAIPEDGFLATMPAQLSFEEAAPSTEGSHDALALLRKAEVRRGQDVLVYGATGAIGSSRRCSAAGRRC
jgi:NADPH:quinone reductase-like Zn-dependent oxidoreductase